MRLKPRIERVCPWCRLGVAFGLLVVEDGDPELPENGSPVIVHDEPRCAVFDQLGGDAFLDSIEGVGVPRGVA